MLAKAGWPFEKVKTALDAAHLHVVQRVGGQPPGAQSHQADSDDLVNKAPESLTAPGPVFFLGRGFLGHGDHS